MSAEFVSGRVDLAKVKGSHIKPIASVPVLPQLTLDIWGGEHSGKSHFIGTAAGSKGLAWQTTEMKSLDGVLQKFEDRNIVVADYASNIPLTMERTDYATIQNYYKRVLKQWHADYEAFLAAGVGVVAWDKALGLWEIMRLAHFGKLQGVLAKDYGPLNAEYADMIEMSSQKGTSLILVNEQDDEWGPTANGKGRETTGKKIRKGQDRTGFLVDASLRAFKQKGTFCIEFISARKEQDLIGSVLENPDFLTVATMLKPEIAWAEVLGL